MTCRSDAQPDRGCVGQQGPAADSNQPKELVFVNKGPKRSLGSTSNSLRGDAFTVHAEQLCLIRRRKLTRVLVADTLRLVPHPHRAAVRSERSHEAPTDRF